MAFRIFMSNLGYMRGINGELGHHVRFAHRHFYCSIATQKQNLRQLADIIAHEDPDLCCFVEIDQGSSDSAYFNQLGHLVSERYPFFDIENKYGQASRLRSLPFSKGKSNAFLSRRAVSFEKLYFTHGTKRLIYKLRLKEGLHVFFAHFSLKRQVRAQQLLQVRNLLHETPGEHILLGDFNILQGFEELAPLLHGNNLRLMNDTHQPTFTFHRSKKVLDLCICSESLASHLDLRIIPQHFSDHAGLLLAIHMEF